IVPTRFGTEAARFSRWTASSATAAAASRRLFIGVVPAWLALPRTSPAKRAPPLMEGTMPSGRAGPGEHRALLDVHLDEAEVIGRIALQPFDRIKRGRQAGVAHRVAHGRAFSVCLAEPARVELADERTGAEKRRLVALALFFGEADDLDRERKPAPGPMQLANADHRHEDAE